MVYMKQSRAVFQQYLGTNSFTYVSTVKEIDVKSGRHDIQKQVEDRTTLKYLCTAEFLLEKSRITNFDTLLSKKSCTRAEYCRTSVARTPSGPWNYVRDRGSSS